MKDPQPKVERGGKREVAPRGLARWLDGVPPLVRSIIYYVLFLTFILGIVPMGAHFVAAMALGLRIELGGVRVAGWIVFAIFFFLYTYCSFWLIVRGRGAYVEFDPPKEFVASGPYQACRNPVAACVLGMLLGLGVGCSSVGILAFFLIALPLAHLQVVRVEEPLLEERFGQTYRDYKDRVPRWVPRAPRDGLT